jgi:ribosomal protein L37AE/L43A
MTNQPLIWYATLTLTPVKQDIKTTDDFRGLQPLRSGDLCPQCGQDTLEYNGMLDLTCSRCGFTSSGGACT